MVMRRVTRFHDESQRVLASFRRTRRQAVGRGIMVGAVAGGLLAGATLIAIGVRWIAGGHGPPYPWLWLIFAFMIPLIVGVLLGGSAGTRVGVIADDLGVNATPAALGSFGWLSIIEIQAERRRSRTMVVLCLDDGKSVRLPAPYDGTGLAHDPSFERKYFTLLNLWETHRNWKSRT
jgi:hypothetical protein